MQRYVSYHCRFFSLIYGTFYILNILVLKKIINFVQKGDCVVAEHVVVEHAAPVVMRAVEDAAQVIIRTRCVRIGYINA